MLDGLKKIFIFLPIFVFLLGFSISEADAKIQASISVSPNPTQIDTPVQIQINANDSVSSILIIDLYVDGFFRGDGYDCTQGTNNPVKTCSAQFTKQFSSKGSYRISGAVLDLNGASTEIPETILTVTEPGAPAPTPTPGGPTINNLIPNPAPISSTINISGSNFCSNIDFDLSRITVIFDQTAVPGGTSISTPPFPLTSNCSLLKVSVPSSLIPANDVKVSVQNTKGVSDSVSLSLEKALPSSPSSPSTPPPGARPWKLETAWPTSPGGTPLDESSGIPDLIKYIYEWGITLGGLAAFAALVVAGFQYLTSLGDPGKIKDAVGRIQSAFLGLVLLLSSWLILNTINPQFTSFQTEPFNPGDLPPVTGEPIEIGTTLDFCDSIALFSEAEHSGKGISIPQNDCVTFNYFPRQKEYSSYGVKDDKQNKECQGNLEFHAASNCGDQIGSPWPVYNEKIYLERTAASVYFRVYEISK